VLHDAALAIVRVAERLGDRGAARERYLWVTEVWGGADPALQPYVTEAREAVERLGR
jgi:hypothetical protein